MKIVKQTMDVLNDVVPGVGKVRALVCELWTEDGRSAFGLSANFKATEAVANAYQMLMNQPISADGKVVGS
jgi:hypothetical protein